MTTQRRGLFVFLTIIALLVCGAAYLVTVLEEPEAKMRVLEVFGAAIGAVCALYLFRAFLLRINRKN